MIFKVFSPVTKTWFYFDHVRKFSEWSEVYEERETLRKCEMALLSENRDPGAPVTQCVLHFENGEFEDVIFDSEGYLLNDEGKTIERIR